MDSFYDWQQWRRVRDIVDAEADLLQQLPENCKDVNNALKELGLPGSDALLNNPLDVGMPEQKESTLGAQGSLRVYVDSEIEPALSLQRFYEFLRPKLEYQGIQFVSRRAGADLQWDPYGGWTYAPPSQNDLPFVSTFHGAMGWFAPWDWEYSDPQTALKYQAYALQQYALWKDWGDRVSAFIVPSFFAGRELCETLGVNADRIAVVHHGVDARLYCPEGPREESVGLLHVVAHWRVKKNIERIIEAYQASGVKLPLTVIAHAWDPKALPAGVRHVQGALPAAKVAEYYRGAQALVFATLSETFGLPALEAMASGCPVIVGRGTATEELFGSASIVVDPFSVPEIAQAMQKMANPATAADFRQRGLLRARSFSWERTAAAHYRVFQKAIWEHQLQHARSGGVHAWFKRIIGR
ncbi:glycosyltransferase family 4 protein [Acidithiobacillus thiooxidans]|uniref:D-inositol 3-phosphate glycosyltransferase n=1 Tax=Acidithiobacillus thiooxidans ATCC 19377 TaxID=637390 RepID=A0A543PZ94_ACITH|nr:glycosyltransferase family 1 protein [Acidithiobacillus thiooxidans]MDX5936496.1 glycosyltransferase family 1 protein [Acidithiobacillus thiooxidans]TQN49403.1 D-inositol 3-phosphate glycosyltransferase [Acidithiobacillus thiooxidans ATCC 19377]